MKIIRISAIWCSSCILTYKNWVALKEEYPNFEYIEYDFDDDEEIIKQYNIGTILPVIIVMNNDTEILRITGEKSKKELFEEIDKLK